jgi:hypothetical protein
VLLLRSYLRILHSHPYSLRITDYALNVGAATYHKRPFVIPSALDIERSKGKWDLGGMGIGASVTVA